MGVKPGIAQRRTALQIRLERERAYWREGRKYRLPGGYERIYLYHVRKTGGTSFTNAMLALGGEDAAAVKRRLVWPGITRSGPYTFVGHYPPFVERRRYFYGWAHQPAWKVKLPPRTFTVAILRDPASRVVSLYRYLADPTSDGDDPFPAPAAQRKLAAEGFTAFLERLPPEELLNQLHMFSDGLDPDDAADRIRASCALVVTTDRLDRAIDAASRLVGRRLPVLHERRSTLPFRPSPMQQRWLREALEPGYRMMDRLGLV